MIPFLIAITLWTAAFVALGVTYEVQRADPPRPTHAKEQAP
jgi:hypothetical protein